MCSVLSLYDRFHLPNHHEFDTHLRSIDSTNLMGKLNTSVVEQENHVLSLKKSYCNEMHSSQHIKLVTYISSCHNQRINQDWLTQVKKRQPDVSFVIDDLGFLVSEGLEKPLLNHCHLDSVSTKSPFPPSLLQDPSGNCSALNSVAYSVAHSHAADPVYEALGCLTQPLLSFAGCKSDYCQATHFSIKDFIDSQLREKQLNPDPSTILESCFLPDLTTAGVIHACFDASSPNLSLSLYQFLNGHDACDFIFIKRPSSIHYFNGTRPHFDIKVRNKVLRYRTSSFVSKTHQENVYSCSSRFSDVFFTVCNIDTCTITEDAFLEMARCCEYIVFKLDSPIESDPNPSIGNASNLKRSLPVSDDPFAFEAPVNPPKKTKIKVTSNQRVFQPSYEWLRFSDTGRLDLFSEQFKICQSSNLPYDDVIINSYARMCQFYRGNSFIYQDTCLSSPFYNQHVRFKGVDQKFIQIINRTGTHWFCISNALTFIAEPNVVEVFDSYVTAESLQNTITVPSYLTRIILLLKPQTNCIRYIRSQQQTPRSNGCGPFALGFLWSLSHGHHPMMYDHLQSNLIRIKVRESFVNNRFIPPCNTSPRNHPKVTLKEFKLNTQVNQFRCI